MNDHDDAGRGDSGGGGGVVDAKMVDAMPDAPLLCFGAYPTVCFSSIADVPMAPLILMEDIDTMTSALCNTHNNQGDFCVVSGAGITIPTGKTIRAFGARPLVLISTTTFDLSGSLDVSSTSAPAALHPTGPGVVAIASCSDSAVVPTMNSGGFGGSFGGKGGNGQPQDQAVVVPISGSAVLFPAKLRAGCPGSAGSTTSSGPGVGGKGGGAVSVIATEIHLNGQINASGAFGSAGGAVRAGGGGGGSGGMIVLDSPAIVPGITFALFANGGGGGQGGAATAGPNPGPGKDGGESTGPTMVGTGGNNFNTAGGAGGSGTAGVVNKDGLAGGPGTPGSSAGGGGGGGAAGFISARGIATNIAPASTAP